MAWSSSSCTSSIPNVRARCDRAWRCRWKTAAGEMIAGVAAVFFGIRDLWSARLASAFSICRAFWKSPRHSSAVPWHARPYASSAVVTSSAMTTRAEGGTPRSERQRATQVSPPSVHWTSGCACTLQLCVFLAVAARLVRRILRGVLDELAPGSGDRIYAQCVAQSHQIQQHVGNLIARCRMHVGCEAAALRLGEPLEDLEQLAGFRRQCHRQVLGRMELLPVALGGERAQLLAQVFEIGHVRDQNFSSRRR